MLRENVTRSGVDDLTSTITARPHLFHPYSHLPITVANTVIPQGCAILNFNQTQFIPWDNPDNIVSAEVQITANRIFVRIFVPVLFLIGGPANVFNMVVFYKQGLQQRINLCLFALSLADALYLTQAIFLCGEQLPLKFNTNVKYGPIATFMTNYNFITFFGFGFVSQILFSMCAFERCICVVSPLKFQTLFRTRTMAVIIICIYIVVLGLYFVVVLKYNIGCVYDPVSGTAMNGEVLGEFYRTHTELINYLNSFVFGVGIHAFSIGVVTTTTIITIIKLRQMMMWRAGKSSSVSDREVALTKMLIGCSLLFIVCVTPNGLFHFTVLFFEELNAGHRYHNLYLTFFWIVDITTFINSTFNFFIYYAMGSRFRETFWSLFSKKTKPNNV